MNSQNATGYLFFWKTSNPLWFSPWANASEEQCNCHTHAHDCIIDKECHRHHLASCYSLPRRTIREPQDFISQPLYENTTVTSNDGKAMLTETRRQYYVPEGSFVRVQIICQLWISLYFLKSQWEFLRIWQMGVRDRSEWKKVLKTTKIFPQPASAFCHPSWHTFSLLPPSQFCHPNEELFGFSYQHSSSQTAWTH